MARKKTQPVYIGIDWAKKQHTVCILDAEQRIDGSFDQDAQAIEQWVQDLQKKYPQRELCIAVEQKNGPLVSALMNYPQLILHPINPKQAARYREALHPSGAKTDPIDAHLPSTWCIKSKQQVGQRRLAAAIRPDDCQRFATADCE